MIWIDVKYANLLSNSLERFRVKTQHPYVANFRCPYCGDSKKSKRKARGYILQKSASLMFFCHNGCPSRSFSRFLEEQFPSIYKEYRLEKFKEGQGQERRDSQPEMNVEQQFEKRLRTESDMTLLHKMLPTLKDLDSRSPGVKYAQSRKIPFSKYDDIFYIDDIQKLGTWKTKNGEITPGIIFPFYNIDSKLSGITCRVISKKLPLRYMTSRILENSDMIYNLLNVDRNETVYCVEGPIDSLFLPNCVACAGSHLHRISSYVPREQVVLIFDNEPRNKDIVRLMLRHSKDFSMVVWPETVREKDINEMICNGRTQQQILSIIRKNTYSGLDLAVRINDWKKVQL